MPKQEDGHATPSSRAVPTLELVIQILEAGDQHRRHAMLHLLDKARNEWAADRERIEELRAALQALSGDFSAAITLIQRAEVQAVAKAAAVVFPGTRDG